MTRTRYPDVLPALTATCRRLIEERVNGEHFIHPTSATLEWNRKFYTELFAKVFACGDVASSSYGALTCDVAREYGQPIDVTRRQLVRALDAGSVLADGRGGDRGIRWWPAGLASTLLQEAGK